MEVINQHLRERNPSSNNQAILARINVANQLANTISVQAGMFIVYDALLEIDNEFSQVNVQM